ncbi:MAG: S8 family serine peptidase [Peptostreptococcaceae bacterium]
MGKRKNKLISTALATSIVITSGITSVVSAQGNEDINKVIESINSTIKSKSQLELKMGFDIAPDINTKTEAMVSIIVELKEDPIALATYKDNKNKLSKSLAQNKVKQSKEKFKSDIDKIQKNSKSKSKIEFGYEYDTVFNGIEMSLPGTEVEKLLQSDQVKAIYNNSEVKLDLPNENQKSKNTNESIAPFMHDSINDIGVDKLHEEGITGKGIKVGVLDTGIDYNHPDLDSNYKGSREKGKQMDEVKGWDFVDNDSDPMETTRKDWTESGQPEYNLYTGSSYYTSHGTHVSGTIAGNGESKGEYAITGVAPEADLYGYRVLGPYGSGATAGIVAAIDKAVKDGMDVINLSLGSNGANPYSPLTIACNNSMLAGVTTVLANGNTGPGVSTLGTPAVSPLSISVGASTTAITLDLYDMTMGKTKVEGQTLAKTFDSSMQDFENIEVVDCGLGKTTDFDGKNIEGKIAFIQRGELSFNEKLMNAKNAGAKYAIVYNNVDGEIPHYLGESTSFIPSIALSKEEGENLKKELEKGNSELSLKVTGETKTEKDLLGDFSSRGPAPDSYEIKPDISAPGVNIFSTYPEFINDTDENKEDYTSAYARISGTSMAAPHIAGVAALIQQENKDYDPFDTKLALMNTADDLKLDYGVNEVGAGRVDAYNAVKSEISIINTQTSKTLNPETVEAVDINHETGSISFGKVLVDGETLNLKDELIIKNNSNKTQTFDVSVEYVAPSKSHGGLDANKNGVKLEVKERALASRNSETKLGVNLIVPKDAEQGLYQGYINLVNTRNEKEKYQIPFSVKTSTPGINPILLDRKSMMNDEVNIDYADGYAGLHSILSFRSKMERVDLVIKDGDSKELVGYLGGFDTKDIPTDVMLMMEFIVNQWASVYPYKDGKIQPYRVALGEGFYTVEMIGKGIDGKTYISGEEFVIDNTPVKNTFKLKGKEIGDNDIIEIKEELLTEQEDLQGVKHKAVWVDGNLYDSTIDLLLEKGEKDIPLLGTNINQALNQVLYRVNGSPFIDGSFRVDEKGNYKFGITREDTEQYGYESLGMELYDMAHVKDFKLSDPEFIVIKEGEPYAKISTNKTEVSKNEELTLSISLNNIKDIKSGKFEFYMDSEYEVSNVKLKDEYKDNYEVDHKVYKGEYNTTLLEVNLNNNGDSNYINDSTNILDITLKLKDDTNPIMGGSALSNKNISLVDKNDKKIKVVASNKARVMANSKSKLGGTVSAQGLRTFATDILNPEKHKIQATLKDSKGNEYEIKLNEAQYSYQNGVIEIEAKNLPLTDEYFELVMEVPGHFQEKFYFKPSKEVDGKRVSKYTSLTPGLIADNIAGDVNNDDVIDINDAKEIAKQYNKKYVNANLALDLTQDGVVNNEDMYFVVENFGMLNPYTDKNIKPEGSKEELQKILNDINYQKPDTNPWD